MKNNFNYKSSMYDVHPYSYSDAEWIDKLANEIDIPFEEKDVNHFDAINADEMFLTSTSLCICPVRKFNGQTIGNTVYGPTTKSLIKAYSSLVEFDFVAQYLNKLD